MNICSIAKDYSYTIESVLKKIASNEGDYKSIIDDFFEK